MSRSIDVPVLVEEARAGTSRAVGRLISLVDDQHPALPEVMAALAPHTGGAHVVGITGAPGVGKSTTTNALVRALRAKGEKVAVIAVDPSSPFSGGALLGDRIRMNDSASDPGVYIRSLASRGHLGGLSVSAPQAIRVLDAAGFGTILVETVGVGQSEVAVAEMVDTFLLLALARGGDQLQGIKRGILEMADVIAVNKADGEHAGDARVAARELSGAMRLMNSDPDARRPPVLTCSAQTGDGLDEVWEAVLEHRRWLESQGSLHARRAEQQREWMWAMVDSELRDAVRRSPRVRELLAEITPGVRTGSVSAVDGAARIIAAFGADLAQRPGE